jgi:chromosome segregation ATPase
MDALQFVWIGGAALGGGLMGAAACYWPLSRTIDALRQRLERAEQARNGAVERSAQAREQIAQLNKAIAELRRAHTARNITPPKASDPDELRARAEKALTEAGDQSPSVQMPRAVFADTEVLGNR